MCASGAVNTDAMFCVEILMYITFHSFIHAYMYINDARNFIFSSLARTSC